MMHEQPFWMKRTPVTQLEFVAVMGYNPSQHYQSLCYAGNVPVENVSFAEAVWYCKELSKQQNLAPCYTFGTVHGKPGPDCRFSIDEITLNPNANGFRLATEREWEWAARAGSQASAYGPIGEIASYGLGLHFGRPTAVGSRKPNAWGLYDMLGSVKQWVWNFYSHEQSENPYGPTTGDLRTLRGSCYWSLSEDVQAARRQHARPGWRNGDTGFRTVRACPVAQTSAASRGVSEE